mgnify:CR=1 FL=1
MVSVRAPSQLIPQSQYQVVPWWKKSELDTTTSGKNSSDANSNLLQRPPGNKLLDLCQPLPLPPNHGNMSHVLSLLNFSHSYIHSAFLLFHYQIQRGVSFIPSHQSPTNISHGNAFSLSPSLGWSGMNNDIWKNEKCTMLRSRRRTSRWETDIPWEETRMIEYHQRDNIWWWCSKRRTMTDVGSLVSVFRKRGRVLFRVDILSSSASAFSGNFF